MFILPLIIHSKLKKTFGVRYDGSPAFPYWRSEDLGINETRFSFFSNGNLLRGSRYFLKGKKPKAIIIFFHGIGDGRASYIKEISLLVKEGYVVYAYDNTGCMESEGKGMISLDQTLIDQKAFFEYLEKDESAKELKRYAVGHSWGGFGAMMSCKKEYKIEKCVSLAGFVKTSLLIANQLPKTNKVILKAIEKALKMDCGKFANKYAIDVIRESDAKVYYLFGEKDRIVPRTIAADLLIKEFEGNPRIRIEEVKNIGHSVYRDPKAEAYVGSLLKQGLGTLDCKEGVSMDLERATVENETLWSKIFGFLAE